VQHNEQHTIIIIIIIIIIPRYIVCLGNISINTLHKEGDNYYTNDDYDDDDNNNNNNTVNNVNMVERH